MAALAGNFIGGPSSPKSVPPSPSGKKGLSALELTLQKLHEDQDRHRRLIDKIAPSLRLAQTEAQHVKQAFSESNYVFIKTLGQGRFGMVKLAKKKTHKYVQHTRAGPQHEGNSTHADNRSYVAVRVITRYHTQRGKVCADEYLGDKERRVILMKQLEALRDLDHPNVCRIKETFEDSMNLYLVMEYYNGGDMLERESEPAPEARVAWSVSQILSGIAHSHERNIVHQDLRPENILYATTDPDSRLVVCDWSCAEFIDATPKDSRSNLITSEYSAPELEPKRRTDRADIWSIGVIAHAMLSFELPFLEGRQELTLGNKISASCRDFLETVLRRDPAQRPSARQALTHPWVSSSTTNACIVRSASTIPTDVMGSVVRFREKKRWQRAAALYASRHLTAPQLHELSQAFKAIDKDNNGVISRDEMVEALAQQMKHSKEFESVAADPAKMSGLIASMDADGSGVISYSEFLAAANDKLMEASLSLCWDAFSTFDTSGDGTISVQEIETMLHTKELEECFKMLSNEDCSKTKQELHKALDQVGGMPMTARQIHKQLDTNCDGRVSFEEFVEALTGGKVQQVSGKRGTI
jgi:calcium-dependent protein kinase